MLERIKELIRSEGLSSGSFADEIGVQRSSLSHILNGRNNASLDFVIKTMQRFTGLNPEWFIMGTGDMYKSKDVENVKLNNIEQDPLSHDLFSSMTTDAPILNEIDESVVEREPIVNEEEMRNMDQKHVSQIMIFFSDSTYQIYKPEKNG